MKTIREIFQTYGTDYLDHFGAAVPQEHRKVINAIRQCRTDHYGFTVYECQNCHETHFVPRSCGNRHCPTCQYQKSQAWLEKQLQRQLPGHHFLITFTMPEAIRPFIRSHQRIGYSALFQTSSEAIKALSLDEKYLGGDLPGFFGVLHTWGRQLNYHPHVHYVVTGGALNRELNQWHPSRIDFFVPVKALSKIYRAKFRDAMIQQGQMALIPPEVWDIDWNVNVQAVGSSEQSIGYLAPYVFRVAISDSRIICVADGHVTFQYRKTGSHRWRRLTLTIMEFMRRFLQHVLPTGFMKIRYYGFMNASCGVPPGRIAILIEISYGFMAPSPKKERKPLPVIRCPLCGGELIYRYSILPNQPSFLGLEDYG